MRVRRPGPDGIPFACVDRLPPAFGGVSFETDDPGRGPLDVTLGGGHFEGSSLSAGRCAGPTAADLAAALPKVRLDLRRLRKGGRTLGLGTRRTFAAGAFTVALDSTVQVRLGRARVTRRDSESVRPSDAGRRRSRRVGLVTLRYALERVEGALVTEFRGLPGLQCAPLDACGLAGTNRIALPADGGTLRLRATTRLPRGGRRPGVARVLRDLRRGRLRPFGGTALGRGATVTAVVTRDGAEACRDERLTPPPSLDVQPVGKDLQVTLAPGGAGGVPADLARTRCPGPGLRRPEGRPSLATGRLRAADLAAPEVRLVLRPRASFTEGPYAAAPGGQIALTLRRVAVRTRTMREVDAW